MKRSLVAAAILVIVAPAFGDPDIMPVRKIKGFATVGYDPVTAKTYPLSGYERFGRQMYWTADQAYLTLYDNRPGSLQAFTLLDWGDLGTPGTGFSIGGFYIIVLGNQDTPTPGGELAITWIAEENGRNSIGRIPWAQLNLVNLPGFPYSPPGWGAGWQFALDLQMAGWQWTLDGNDLDGDGLVDFGYSYWFVNMPPGTDAGIPFGPYVPAGVETGGAEDLFDLFGDADYQTYYGTYWLGPGYYSQFCQKLHDWNCPNAGTSPPAVMDYCWTDIYPAGPGGPLGSGGDCIVNISDLGALLPNYEQPGTFTYLDGDVYPKYFGDSVVDISDLGQMLAQYGDNCN